MIHYNVVAAVILREGKILCVQRGRTRFSYTSYRYEFPGGKIEEGESEEEALIREIREELKIEIDVGRKLGVINHDYPDFSITLHLYLCSIIIGEIILTEHTKSLWATRAEMKLLNWADADRKWVGAI